MSLLGSSSISDYILVDRIGEGAHGIVFKAQHKHTGYDRALKKIPLTKLETGLPINIIREIKSLQELDNEHIVALRDVFAHGAGIVLVFDYMPCSVSDIICDVSLHISEDVAKRYMIQILDAVSYCHAKNIMHRDIKPANMLLSSKGQIKIADFGLATVFDSGKDRPYSHEVATRWYRSPELLYGSRHYTPAVDMWAVGCTFSELLTRRPLFPGDSDIDQLGKVLRALGTPTEDIWPGVSKLPDFSKITFYGYDAQPWKQIIPGISENALVFLRDFLCYNPTLRITADKALQHKYFYAEYPPPLDSESLPRPPSRKQLDQTIFDKSGVDVFDLNLDNMLADALSTVTMEYETLDDDESKEKKHEKRHWLGEKDKLQESYSKLEEGKKKRQRDDEAIMKKKWLDVRYCNVDTDKQISDMFTHVNKFLQNWINTGDTSNTSNKLDNSSNGDASKVINEIKQNVVIKKNLGKANREIYLGGPRPSTQTVPSINRSKGRGGSVTARKVNATKKEQFLPTTSRGGRGRGKRIVTKIS